MSDLYLILVILLRGTWIILKFVKDKDNRLTHNQWSGGQYLNSTLGFNKGTTATVFTIENDSLKVSNNGQSQYTSCRIQYNVTSEDHLKTMTLTSKIISHDQINVFTN